MVSSQESCVLRLISITIIVILIIVVFPHQISAQERSNPELLQIAFGSCLQQRRPHRILEQVVALNPDIFVFTGDNIYADTTNPEYMKNEYDRLASSPYFQKLQRSVKIYATWDDHDYGRNDAGADYTMKHDSERLFESFWGIGNGPAGSRDGVYQAYMVGTGGRRVQILLLDTRFFRSPLTRGRTADSLGPYIPDSSPDSTILGEEQWEWLGRQLEEPAELRLVVSSIQILAQHHGWESWSNYPHERKRLIELIRSTEATGVLFLSGDRHFAEISHVDSGVPYPLFDITSSGLNRRYPSPIPTPNDNRIEGYYLQHNFGVIDVDWSYADPQIRVTIRDADGVAVIERHLSLGALQPARVD